MTWSEFLAYAAGPGVNAVVGFILSFLLEWVPGWEQVGARQKRLVTMGLSFIVPVTATLALHGAQVTGDQIWAGLVAGFVAFYGSQAGHAFQLAAATGQTPSPQRRPGD